jgi:hypothetical protein
MDERTRVPCPTCPWRKSTPARGFPGGIVDAAGLLRMIHGGPHEHIMQCHCTDEAPEPCVGFVLQVGRHSMACRLAAIFGVIDYKSMRADEDLHTLGSLIAKHGGRPQKEVTHG